MKTVAVALLAALFVLAAGCERDEPTVVEPGSAGADLVTAITAARPAQAPFADLTEIGLSIGNECVLVVVADTEDERVQGLRAVDDLGPYAGMLFAFPTEIEVRFTMQDTITPLTIGFFDAHGAAVSTADMVPCPPGTNCPLYSADGPFRFALEVFAGKPLPNALVPCADAA